MRMSLSSARAVTAARNTKASTVRAVQSGRAAGRDLVRDQLAERTGVAGHAAIDAGRGFEGQLGEDQFREAVRLLQVRVAGEDEVVDVEPDVLLHALGHLIRV